MSTTTKFDKYKQTSTALRHESKERETLITSQTSTNKMNFCVLCWCSCIKLIQGNITDITTNLVEIDLSVQYCSALLVGFVIHVLWLSVLTFFYGLCHSLFCLYMYRKWSHLSTCSNYVKLHNWPTGITGLESRGIGCSLPLFFIVQPMVSIEKKCTSVCLILESLCACAPTEKKLK